CFPYRKLEMELRQARDLAMSLAVGECAITRRSVRDPFMLHRGPYSELFGDRERALVEAAAGERLIEVEHLRRPGETALVFSEGLRDAVVCRVARDAVMTGA
ncbi:MAG: hypothetical protein ACK4OH_18605, partial [Acidovorax temperans]|uniref:hypothetical protein n=1 Tax=Acidovorax temperans TaxID=80878 RepID=UPI00391DBCB3